MVEWVPTDADLVDMGDSGDLRAGLLDNFVEHFGHKAGIGAAAFIAKTLRR